MPGLHFKLKHTLTMSEACLGMFLATAAMEDRELRHLDVYWRAVLKVLQHLLRMQDQDQGLKWRGVPVGGPEMSAYI